MTEPGGHERTHENHASDGSVIRLGGLFGFGLTVGAMAALFMSAITGALLRAIMRVILP